MDSATLSRVLNSAVTGFDRKQEAKHKANPRAYYNAYALPQYLGRVADVVADVEAGATIEAAIVAGFTPGPLRNACLKAVGGKASTQEAHGLFSGMPVYQPASQR